MRRTLYPFLFNTFFFLVKLGTYNTHNAPLPLTPQTSLKKTLNTQRKVGFDSHACREKCFRSEDAVFPAAEGMGGATVEPSEPTTGRMEEATAAAVLEESPPSPNRCWMEWSWKQGSESRTEAARETLRG